MALRVNNIFQHSGESSQRVMTIQKHFKGKRCCLPSSYPNNTDKNRDLRKDVCLCWGGVGGL